MVVPDVHFPGAALKGLKEKASPRTRLSCGAPCAWRFCKAETFPPGSPGSSRWLLSPSEPRRCVWARQLSQAWKEREKSEKFLEIWLFYGVEGTPVLAQLSAWRGGAATREDKEEALRERIFRSRQLLSKISCHFQVGPQQKGNGSWIELTWNHLVWALHK